MIPRTGLGHDSHRFLSPDSSKPCAIGGVIFDEVPGFNANSDGDVIFHALCNAISSLTGTPVLGAVAEELRIKDGVTDSEVYLLEAFKTLGKQKIVHVAITLEAKKPRFSDRLDEIKQNIARILQLEVSQIGITASSGEGLTDFGCGDGVQCYALITTVED